MVVLELGVRVAMNREMYTIIGVGVALSALTIASQNSLRADMRDGHATLRVEIAEVRSDMRENFAAVRTEMGNMRAEMADIRADIGLLGERVARVEVRLGLPAVESVTPEQ